MHFQIPPGTPACSLAVFTVVLLVIYISLMITHKTALIKKLKAIANEEGNSIKEMVAFEVLDSCQDDTEVIAFIKDIASFGCSSGIISSLIYTADTHAFFDKHSTEIEKLHKEYEQKSGLPVYSTGNIKNDLAWFGFEETARKLANELGIEV